MLRRQSWDTNRNMKRLVYCRYGFVTIQLSPKQKPTIYKLTIYFYNLLYVLVRFAESGKRVASVRLPRYFARNHLRCCSSCTEGSSACQVSHSNQFSATATFWKEKKKRGFCVHTKTETCLKCFNFIMAFSNQSVSLSNLSARTHAAARSKC